MNGTRYRRGLAKALLRHFDVPPRTLRSETTRHPNGEVRQEKTVAEPTPLPTFEGFAAGLGVSTAVLRAWRDEHPEFRAAWDMALDRQRELLLQNGLLGLYNAAFARFAAVHLCGMEDAAQGSGGEGPRILEDLDDG